MEPKRVTLCKMCVVHCHTILRLCTMGVRTIPKEVHLISMRTTGAHIILYTHMHVHLGAKVPC